MSAPANAVAAPPWLAALGLVEPAARLPLHHGTGLHVWSAALDVEPWLPGVHGQIENSLCRVRRRPDAGAVRAGAADALQMKSSSVARAPAPRARHSVLRPGARPMSSTLQLLDSGPTLSRLFVSVAVLGGALALAKMLQRYFANSQGHFAPDARRGALVASRNLLFTLTLLLLAALWFAELRGVALSIAAIATALVITGKELVLALFGRLLQATKRPFSVGDLIEIGGFSGQVIDIGLFSTTLLETDAARQYTGSTVELPNVLFVTTTLRNHSHTGRYVIESLRLSVPADAEVARARERLLACAQAVAGEHLRDARRHLRAVEADEVIALPDFQPRVLIEPKDAYQVDLVVRYAAPSARRAYLAQDVLSAYYASLAAAAAQKVASAPATGAAGEEAGVARTRIVPGAPGGAPLRPAS